MPVATRPGLPARPKHEAPPHCAGRAERPARLGLRLGRPAAAQYLPVPAQHPLQPDDQAQATSPALAGHPEQGRDQRPVRPGGLRPGGDLALHGGQLLTKQQDLRGLPKVRAGTAVAKPTTGWRSDQIEKLQTHDRRSSQGPPAHPAGRSEERTGFPALTGLIYEYRLVACAGRMRFSAPTRAVGVTIADHPVRHDRQLVATTQDLHTRHGGRGVCGCRSGGGVVADHLPQGSACGSLATLTPCRSSSSGSTWGPRAPRAS